VVTRQLTLQRQENRTLEPIKNFSQTDLDAPLTMPFINGHAVVYTHRSPDKTTVNEDCAALIPFTQNAGLLLIADGLGGQPGGDTASRTAINTLSKTVTQANKSGVSLRDAVLDGIEKANRRILNTSTGAATTLAVVEIQDNSIRPYHVGDSMILLCGQRGKVKLQSIAHSPVGYAVESGLLDENEAVHHEERHLISNVVGSDEMSIEIGTRRKLAARDTLILASDGLFDNLYTAEIIDTIRTGKLEQAAARLVQLSHGRMNQKTEDLPCHPDDLTFILFRRS
jgi:serine/threonine protein phosphatase PrpC